LAVGRARAAVPGTSSSQWSRDVTARIVDCTHPIKNNKNIKINPAEPRQPPQLSGNDCSKAVRGRAQPSAVVAQPIACPTRRAAIPPKQTHAIPTKYSTYRERHLPACQKSPMKLAFEGDPITPVPSLFYCTPADFAISSPLRFLRPTIERFSSSSSV
jgi:hypothetical protein